MRESLETTRQRVREFLKSPGPTFETKEEWAQRCLQLGDDAPKIFIEVLEEGSPTETEQELAMFGLRLFGYGVGEEGRPGPDKLWWVRYPGQEEWVAIKPRVAPEDLIMKMIQENQELYDRLASGE